MSLELMLLHEFDGSAAIHAKAIFWPLHSCFAEVEQPLALGIQEAEILRTCRICKLESSLRLRKAESKTRPKIFDEKRRKGVYSLLLLAIADQEKVAPNNIRKPLYRPTSFLSTTPRFPTATLPHVQYTLINEPSARCLQGRNVCFVALELASGCDVVEVVWTSKVVGVGIDLGCVGANEGSCRVSASEYILVCGVSEHVEYYPALQAIVISRSGLSTTSATAKAQDLSFTVQPSTPPASPNNDNQKLSVTLVDMLSPLMSSSRSRYGSSPCSFVNALGEASTSKPWLVASHADELRVFVGGCAAFVGERRCEREDGWDVDYGSSGNATVTEGGTDGNGNGLLEVTKRRRNPYV
ncbi:hypothetical protein BDP27DRAFT_1370655 [Rhodocollybia butyracea]|uniref:Uncharacterized protein n=1 Tax=Rhodocollybia butyracea TaxID=206335 RepID=A0A9P5PBX5_9AGAR|nr:hypothetical protein BDP27DRAFT_1370655 [Rhodocollybia butyracea]